jgi:hypothetical protein
MLLCQDHFKTMKRIFVFLVLTILAGACSVTRQAKSVTYKITVIDKKTNAPVDSARVVLISVVDYRNIYKYVNYTDAHGRCSFFLDYNPSAQYRVGSMKQGYTDYFDESYADLDRSFSSINEKTGNSVKLYLTSDTLNHRNFWASRATRYDIDTLISLLKSNCYPLRSEFPLLVWEDIPELLAVGNSRTVINKYPVNVAFSGYPKDCYLGIVALWFIESIRIATLKNAVNPNEKFPSLTPSLRDLKRFSHGYLNDNEPSAPSETMEKAYQVYLRWWEKVKSLDKDNACRIDPLEFTMLEWQ